MKVSLIAHELEVRDLFPVWSCHCVGGEKCLVWVKLTAHVHKWTWPLFFGFELATLGLRVNALAN